LVKGCRALNCVFGRFAGLALAGFCCAEKKFGGLVEGVEGGAALFCDFLFLLFGELNGYVDVFFLVLFLAGLLLVSCPEEGPADCPDDDDYGQEK